MINRINLRALRDAEFLQLFQDILGILAPAPAATIGAQRTALAGMMTRVDERFQIDRASPITEILRTRDAERDGLLTGFSLIVSGLTYHYDVTIRNNAIKVARHLEVYGPGIQAQSYNAQTATITNLLDDLATDPILAPAVGALGLAGWTGALTTSNTAFQTQYMARTAELAAEESPDTLKSLRTEAIAAWKALRKKVEGYHAVTDGAAPWDTMVPNINALIDQYNTLLAQRAGGDDEEEDEEEEVNGPDA